jgi:hypothetical protein
MKLIIFLLFIINTIIAGTGVDLDALVKDQDTYKKAVIDIISREFFVTARPFLTSIEIQPINFKEYRIKSLRRAGIDVKSEEYKDALCGLLSCRAVPEKLNISDCIYKYTLGILENWESCLETHLWPIYDTSMEYDIEQGNIFIIKDYNTFDVNINTVKSHLVHELTHAYQYHIRGLFSKKYYTGTLDERNALAMYDEAEASFVQCMYRLNLMEPVQSRPPFYMIAEDENKVTELMKRCENLGIRAGDVAGFKYLAEVAKRIAGSSFDTIQDYMPINTKQFLFPKESFLKETKYKGLSKATIDKIEQVVLAMCPRQKLVNTKVGFPILKNLMKSKFIPLSIEDLSMFKDWEGDNFIIFKIGDSRDDYVVVGVTYWGTNKSAETFDRHVRIDYRNLYRSYLHNNAVFMIRSNKDNEYLDKTIVELLKSEK